MDNDFHNEKKALPPEPAENICFLPKLSFSGSRLTLWVVCRERGMHIERLILRFRSKLLREQTEYTFREISRRKTAQGERVKAFLDLKDADLRSMYWDALAVMQDEEGNPAGEAFLCMTYSYRLFLSFLYRGHFKGKDGCIFYPFNLMNTALCFQYRPREPYENASFYLKEAAAFLIYCLGKPFWDRQNIRLVFEKYCQMAQDNGYYFFRYCMMSGEEARSDARIFYVIDPASGDRANLLPWEDHVIDFLSLKHLIYIQAAKLYISTDSRNHLYVKKSKFSLIRRSLRKKPIVFLQHGVTAMKRVDFFYGKGKGAGCSLFIVTSEMEKEIVRHYFGYEKNEIANTGFARWDVLEDRSAEGNELLIMPTWRAWLENATKMEFMESDYYRSYMKLLNDPAFEAFLERHDLTACFYLHSKFREYIGDFSVPSGRIRLIVFGEVPANELLMRCRALVTDYSSVSWDVFYQGKPVIFYQFDRKDYLEAHGSYIDFESELFGPCALDEKTLLEDLEETAARGFALNEIQRRMLKAYFPVRDHNNCKRICEAIERKWGVKEQ